MFKWFAILLVLAEAAVIAGFALYKPGSLALWFLPVIPLTVVVALLWSVRSKSITYRIARLLPEDITSYEGAVPVASAPEGLSLSIVERASQIKNVLSTRSPSEIEVEMCAIGYRACVNDMITLSHLINEELPNAKLPRRLTLRRARRKATEALARAREALPPGALRATHQEQQ